MRVGARPDEQAVTQRLLSRFVNLELDASVADRAGDLIAQGKRSDKPILVPDAIIAATALVHNITLVTFNVQDFEHVANLSLHPLSS